MEHWNERRSLNASEKVSIIVFNGSTKILHEFIGYETDF